MFLSIFENGGDMGGNCPSTQFANYFSIVFASEILKLARPAMSATLPLMATLGSHMR